jgi:hypothetical protein
MTDKTTSITLPSGRTAVIRKAKVRDLLQAHRVVGFSDEPMAIAMGLVAQVVLIDGKSLLFEDVMDLPAEDGLALNAAVLEEEPIANFSQAPGRAAEDFSAPPR